MGLEFLHTAVKYMRPAKPPSSRKRRGAPIGPPAAAEAWGKVLCLWSLFRHSIRVRAESCDGTGPRHRIRPIPHALEILLHELVPSSRRGLPQRCTGVPVHPLLVRLENPCEAEATPELHPALAIEAPIEALEEMSETAHYSQRWPLGTSPSCRVFNNAMSLISPTL